MRLTNKVAIITGGGSGIGQACAYLFAQEGAKVVIAQRTVTTGEATVAAIKNKGGEAIFVQTDVTSAQSVAQLVQKTLKAFGRVAVLFNNAGSEQKPSPIEKMEEAEWDKVYDANVKSIFLVTKYAVPEMKKAGSGSIINTASLLGVRPRGPNQTAYCSSKGAVIALTKALAVELAPQIRVNCLYPTLVDTPLARRASAEKIKETGWAEFKRGYESLVPLKRMATPEDVAYGALYLASEESAMLTGVCLPIDGGLGI
ncbi:MAG: SDR family oxidoreductase [Chloroflexi bacterium]|nr:SDR family oxidoreductase [Chloroflexota bacterium]